MLRLAGANTVICMEHRTRQPTAAHNQCSQSTTASRTSSPTCTDAAIFNTRLLANRSVTQPASGAKTTNGATNAAQTKPFTLSVSVSARTPGNCSSANTIRLAALLLKVIWACAASKHASDRAEFGGWAMEN